jgi:hypothetical protein
MPRSKPRNEGYVLVLTLGVITLASIALAGLARYSIQHAAAANEVAADLQQRWGIWSVRHVLLSQANEILDAQVPDDMAGAPPWPKPGRLAAEFELAGSRYSVSIADEDAKLNLSTLYARKRERLLPAIQRLGAQSQAPMPTVHIRPDGSGHDAFRSWGQVFDLDAVPRTGRAIEAVGSHLTCWGNGRLNVRRADDTVLRETALIALSPKDASKLIGERRNWGGQGLDELLDPLGLRRPQLLAIRRLLDTESKNYSLLVAVTAGRRERGYLFVDRGRSVTFAW